MLNSITMVAINVILNSILIFGALGLPALGIYCLLYTSDVTSIMLECAGSLFTVKGSVTKSAGWRAVFGEKEDGERCV